MSQLAREKDHVDLGALVSREQREGLVELARQRDRSVSSVVRQAVTVYLERERHAGFGDAA